MTLRMPARFSSTLASIALLLAGAAGCGATQTEARAVTAPSPAVTERGETVYFGSVFPLHGHAEALTFVYERRVETRGDEMVSTHVTREASGAIAVAESAVHSSEYALSSYTLHASQLGQTGTVHVEKDRVVFRLLDGKEETSQVEETSGPVVVGPTLVGYIVRHLGELRAGQTVDVRLAVLDRLETIGFDLRAVPGEAGQTRIRMTASSFVYGLVVDPLHFTFDARTEKLLRLEGRVPPKIRDGGSWQDFDARVDYRFVAAAYR